MSRRDQLIRWKRRASREFYQIWLVAALTYGVGDIITTMMIVYGHVAVGEANPFVRWTMEAGGLGGFLAAKLGVFLLGILLSWYGVKTGSLLFYYAPAMGMTLFGFIATAINLGLVT